MDEVQYVETCKNETINVHNSQLRVAVRGPLDILQTRKQCADVEALRELYAHTKNPKG